METKITKNIDGSWDLSQINNIGDLEAEIAYLKTKVEGDFAQIKNSVFETGCGIDSDLNGDGIINDFDIKLFKEALKEKYDE